MKRPTEASVLGRTIRIKWKKKMEEGTAGEWDDKKGAVTILMGQTPLDEADTVLHELGHSVLYAQGREAGGEVEELYVRALATGFLVLLRQNPELAAWLLREFPA